MKKEIPVWEKYMLTTREAAEYFHLGEKTMRAVIDDNEGDDFFIMVGNRVMVKRKMFEAYLDSAAVLRTELP